ncbi:MAG: hypothetical protein RJQ21_19625 [Rhodospirillales bacterium]
MNRHLIAVAALLALAFTTPAMAQHAHGHAGQPGGMTAGPAEPGQSAFAAIAEIVALLRADPATDWSRVDIEALRRHLADMDNVTLRAAVAATASPEGAIFDVTSADPSVSASIRRMVIAHAATMSGVDGMAMIASETGGGARLAVTGPEPAMIRGLGFIGLMTVGMHHQQHHLMLAKGGMPH